jgi:sec-independent protein translocase protein TatB
MLDFGFDKIALISAVALIVIGPEKLPRVARTVGALIGKAQRYVADVKAEVNRSIELEELQKMKKQFETAATDIQSSVQREVSDASQAFESSWSGATAGLEAGATPMTPIEPLAPPPPTYKRPNKKWRLAGRHDVVQAAPGHIRQAVRHTGGRFSRRA